MRESMVMSERRLEISNLMARAAVLAFCVAFPAFLAATDAPFRAVTDNLSYNVGETVRVRIFPLQSATAPANIHVYATLRYAGESRPLLNRVPLPAAATSSSDGEYRALWKIPSNAKTGRYELDLTAADPASNKEMATVARAASFAVHRKLLRIERLELGKTFYTAGDSVACRAVLRNLTDRPLTGLRVEFSERYWPWIAQTSERAGVDVFPIVKELTLKPKAELEVRSENAATARKVDDAAVQQYAVVVWDSARKTVLDIAFSPLTFIQPPGGSSEKPYPLQYVYPRLSSVDTESYRQFTRPGQVSAAIRFDAGRTMFAPGDFATVKFSLTNNTERPWKDVTIRASLRALGSAEFGRQTIAEKTDVAAHSEPLEGEAKFQMPSDGAGSYRVVVEVFSSAGEVLAANQLELAANPMPKSVLIFCAHEDDEGAHAGIIRAAVENHIPIHIVYFTSGDAGSCDRYYQRSCGPAEALNFGALRMEEARASVGHLGLPRENIHFLGLPDGGSGEIWFRHVEPSHPYLSVLLASDHAPYEGVERSNLPYARQSVVQAAKDLIKRFGPEAIYTGHPDERHVDHRTNNWFVAKALQELAQEGAISPNLKLFVDQSYGPGPQRRAPYRYEKHSLLVPPEVWARVQEAQWFYQSQSGNRNLGKIRPFDQLPRQEVHWQVLDWKDHAGWNEKTSD
jgi:LmbE family N-acetylglucosaminyl deacetylase